MRELTVGDQHLRLTVVEHEGDGPSIEPHVERVEHGATHRYTELTLEHLWCIPEHRSHRIAATDAALHEGRGEPAAAGVGLGPGEAPVHVDDRRPLWAGQGAPIEELERRERGEVCVILLEPDIVWTSHKESPIAGPWIGSPTLVQVSLTDCLVPGKRSNRKAPVRTAIYALAVVCLAVFQRRIVYFPDRRLTRRPAEAGMSGVEELRLLTDDGEMLVAWHLPPRDGHPLILYFHNSGGRGGQPGSALSQVCGEWVF